VSTHWSTVERWTFDCLFGCHEGGFESREDAELAETGHDCMHARFQED